MGKKQPETYRLISRIIKSPVFSTTAFAAILLFMFADTFSSILSSKNNKILQAPPTRTTPAVEDGQVGGILPVTLNGIPETTSTTEGKAENDDPLIPPLQASVEERMEWFRRKLPELEILKSNGLSVMFHSRVLELFSKNCSAQFFMIWLSTAQSFGPRELLAVDTLFSVSPNGCLVILSSSMDSPKGYNILKPLQDRGFNVIAVTPDLPFLVKSTPAETWLDELKGGNMDPGSIPLFNHLSDLIRLAVLYKYGGVYLDTDFIFVKDLSGLRNAVGAQSINQVTKKWARVNGAVMIFDIQHPLLVDFLQEFATTFNGNKWGHNGPYLVSRVLERIEGRPEYDVTILHPKAFYPVDWIKIAKLFKKPETEEDRKWADETLVDLSSGCYMVHLIPPLGDCSIQENGEESRSFDVLVDQP